jgi:hypothetical protein
VPQAVKSLNNAKKLVFDYPEELRCTSKAPTVKRSWPISYASPSRSWPGQRAGKSGEAIGSKYIEVPMIRIEC